MSVPAAAGQDPKRCLESTCRQVPFRETLTAIGFGTPYARAILGGFEQGAGVGGGVQLTSAGLIPAVEFRAAALTSMRWYRRFDLEAFLPNIAGSRNHADVWFSYLQRQCARASPASTLVALSPSAVHGHLMTMFGLRLARAPPSRIIPSAAGGRTRFPQRTALPLDYGVAPTGTRRVRLSAATGDASGRLDALL